MSGNIVVGYTATDAGADAVALGARLAAASGSCESATSASIGAPQPRKSAMGHPRVAHFVTNPGSSTPPLDRGVGIAGSDH